MITFTSFVPRRVTLPILALVFATVGRPAGAREVFREFTFNHGAPPEEKFSELDPDATHDPTVSKALRDDPTIPEARRHETKEIAARLGYHPNPLVAASRLASAMGGQSTGENESTRSQRRR